MAFLKQHAESLWTANLPFHILKADLGHRMTVIRLPSRSLWVHSPIQYSAEIADEIAALGPVSDIVVPSRFHDTFVREWFMAYEDARIVVAPGVVDDNPGWPSTAELTATPLPDWEKVIDLAPLAGIPRANEFAFLHRPSRTLILTDLAFHFPRGSRTGWTRTFLQLNGAWGKLRSSRVFRLVISNPETLDKSLDRVRAWDFDRIIMGHGETIEVGGQGLFQKSFPRRQRSRGPY